VNTRKQQKNPITSPEVCGLALYPDCGEVKFAHHNWTLDLSFMGEKPEFEEPEIPEVSVLRETIYFYYYHILVILFDINIKIYNIFFLNYIIVTATCCALCVSLCNNNKKKNCI
jgi:hypothetical protein